MILEVITTVTSHITLGDNGIDDVKHSVKIDGTNAEGLTTGLIYAAARGGLTAGINGIDEHTGSEQS